MAFKCEFTIFLHGSDGFSEGSIALELPFAPYRGLIVHGLSGADEGDEIDRCVYILDQGNFLLSFESDVDVSYTLAELKESWGLRWTWRDK